MENKSTNKSSNKPKKIIVHKQMSIYQIADPKYNIKRIEKNVWYRQSFKNSNNSKIPTTTTQKNQQKQQPAVAKMT